MTDTRPIAPTPVEPPSTGGVQGVGERRERRRARPERRRKPAPAPVVDEEPEPIRPERGRIDVTV